MSTMNVPGYEPLADILTAAYSQAAVGKGAERHAGGQPFDQQPMQSISDLFDSPYGMAFQVTKKLHEGIKMDTPERQERELLGCIVYTAGIILWLRRQREPEHLLSVLRANPAVDTNLDERLTWGHTKQGDSATAHLNEMVTHRVVKEVPRDEPASDVSLEQEIEAKVAALGGWIEVPDTGWPFRKHRFSTLCQVTPRTPIYYKHPLSIGTTDRPEDLYWTEVTAYRCIEP